MKNRLAIRLLQIFSVEDLIKFGYFLKMRKAGNAEDKLFEFLKPFHPEFDKPECNLLEAGKYAFPNSISVGNKKIIDKLSDLAQTIKDYLAVVVLLQDKAEVRFLTARYFYFKNHHQFFLPALRESENALYKREERDKWFYLLLYKLSNARYFYPLSEHYHKKIAPERFNLMVETLDLFIILSKLEHSIEATHRNKLVSENHVISLADAVKSLALKDEFKKALPNFFLLLLDFHRNESIEKFKELIDNLTEIIDLISEEEKANLITWMINEAIFRFNRGDLEYQALAYFLYQMAFGQGYFQMQGFMSPGHFTNFFILGTDQPENSNWLQNLLQQAPTLLPEERLEETTTICQAYLDFASGDFKKVMNSLKKVAHNNVSDTLKIKSLLLRSTYELFLVTKNLQFQEAAITEVESFRTYLSKQKQISPVGKAKYENFRKILMKLYRLKGKSNLPTKKRKLKTEIIMKEDLVCRKWLLDKVELIGQ
ncbi:MAG: hypothetical protein AAF502_13050 [Bacteroidota bacterium]